MEVTHQRCKIQTQGVHLPMPITRKIVIVVDDEPDTTEMFAEMIRLSGHQVLKSYGGTPAIGLISNVKPDVVLLDIMMPDLSGLEVLRFIRRDPRLQHIPVIVATVKGLPSDIQAGLEAGATVYLTKPVAFEDLRKAIEDVVQDVEQTTVDE